MNTVAIRYDSSNRFPAPGRSIASYFADPIEQAVDELAAAIQAGRSVHDILEKLVRLTAPRGRR